LYFYGKLPPFTTKRPKSIAIVGARKPTKYGEEIAYKLAHDLAGQGIIIISGLAYGIDSIAHRAALAAGGLTLAILGTPIDKIYPPCHISLSQTILKSGGAIISEYPPAADLNYKRSFLERNRLISALSDAVIVVEAATRSGSLSTAAHALAQGREVLAVPGPITSPLSAGTNKLIRQGAHPITETSDILTAIYPDYHPPTPTVIFGDTEIENHIIECIKSGIRDGDQILKNLKISTPDFHQTLTLMEIKGLIRSLGANLWTLS
jgi:DNA processing protein